MIPTYLAIAIVLVGAAVAAVCFLSWSKNRRKPWAWIHLAYSVIGAYWAGLYLILLFGADRIIDSAAFGRDYARPANLIMLSVILAAALIGRERE